MTTLTDDFTETEEAVFLSSANDLTLVRKGQRKRPMGEDGEFFVTDPDRFQFKDGSLTVTDPADIAWLREHENNGALFHERGVGADGVVDDTDKVVALIIDLAFDGELDKIADILVAERKGLGRPTILSAAERAISAREGHDALTAPLGGEDEGDAGVEGDEGA